MDSLILIANPGSASRKYALYQGEKKLATVHFEIQDNEIIYSLKKHDTPMPIRGEAGINHLTFAGVKVWNLLKEHLNLSDDQKIKAITMRLVVPSSDFQHDQLLTPSVLEKLKGLQNRAPLHIHACLQEINILNHAFPKAPILGVSDSAFHITKPKRAQYYGIPISDADNLDIKRFGYHGLSAESAMQTLKKAGRLPKRTILCHLGSGVSVTALQNGKSVDTTMGYSPLEGVIMATRSGTLDIAMLPILKNGLKLTPNQLHDYLNFKSGLAGLSGVSSDIRVLLREERSKNANAKLALEMYVSHIQQAIGQMSAVLGGVDALVFTGTVGERSRVIRHRILENLTFLGLELSPKQNFETIEPTRLTLLSPASHPGRVYVLPIDETEVMLNHALSFKA